MRLVYVAAVLAAVGCTDEAGGTDDTPRPTAECAESDKITVYADNDRDSFGAPDTAKVVCPPLGPDGLPSGELPRGYAANDDDCDDFRANVNPGGIEVCDGLDNDCDTESDEGLREEIFFIDGDGDGYGNPELDLAISSCAPPPGFVDSTLVDCNDADAGVSPDAVEICNLIDDNCNERIDDGDPGLDLSTAPTWWLDGDNDSFGGDESFLIQCSQPDAEWVLNSDDCNDADIDVSPAGTEVCNQIDDDCDDHIDDSDNAGEPFATAPYIDPTTQSSFFLDEDLDGYGDPDPNKIVLACYMPWFATTNDDDCDDAEPLLGLPAPWVLDNDFDGYGAGAQSAPSCTPPGAGYVLVAKGLDCNDADLFTSPIGNEICDGKDNDCDSLFDDADPSLNDSSANTFYQDKDLDGFGNNKVTTSSCAAPLGFVADDTDCNDQNDEINPDANEVCDGGDNDCDDLVDASDDNVDLSTTETFWFDGDSDGYGNPGLPTQACGVPNSYTTNPLDCDDTDATSLADDVWLIDVDGDGVGAGATTGSPCTSPGANYVPASFGTDCSPTNDQVFPGHAEICNNGLDDDCVGGDAPC